MGSRLASAQEGNWPDLQRAMMLKAAVVLSLVAWFGWYRASVADPWDARVMFVAVLAVVVCLWAALTKRLSPAWAGMIQVATLFTAVYVCYAFLHLQVAMIFFVVPLLLAAFVLPIWTAPTLAVVACAATYFSSSAPREMLWAYHLLYLSVGVLAMMLAGELRAALRHAWHYTEHTAALAREVRVRQGEVNRLNKALKVSNGLLKRSFHELALAQKETEEARHLKEQFATTVSHELRTPLSIILGFVDVMQHYPEVYGEVNWTPMLRRDLSEIQRSAQYLSRLVDDILDLARVQALKMPIHREQTDLCGLMTEVVDLASRLLLEKSAVRLKLDVPQYLPSLYLDHTRIRQVLLNLLANACRFTSEGEIRVGATLGQDEVVVAVSDTGPGIPADQLETIFEEFRQGAPAALDEQRDGGKGLGLAIAKHFVHMHGGRIWAESKQGQGSTFHFSLPIAPKQVVALAAPPTRDVLHGSELPLVVLVDEGEGQAFLSRHLEQYQVVSVPDIVQARKLVREQHPHAVIVNVPPEPGDARQGTAPLMLPEPVPLLQCSLPVGRWFMEPDLFDDWLAKPVDSGRLEKALGKILGQDGKDPAGLPSPPSFRKVLVVDDDHAFVRLIRRILEARFGDCEVSWAHSGEEALEKLRQHPVDVLIVDLALPGVSGRIVARTVREECPGQTAIIAVTGLQPGLEGPTTTPHSFAVTSCTGFGEEDILELIKSCLARLKPAYVPEEPAPELLVALGATQAS